jgi:hypothetical protein
MIKKNARGEKKSAEKFMEVLFEKKNPFYFVNRVAAPDSAKKHVYLL